MKENWKAGNMLYPLPVALVSLNGKNNVPNIITIAWCGTCCSNPPMLYVSIRKERYSYEYVKQNREFVVNLVNEDLASASDYCGVKSGKDVDKFKECNLTPVPSKYVNAPSILESPVNIECKVTQIIELGSHDMFIAEVLGVTIENDYLDSNNRFALDEAHLITYSHGHYYTLGKQLGKFGHSVKKK